MDVKEEIFVSEEEKARMTNWQQHGKLIENTLAKLAPAPEKISTGQVHEVALAVMASVANGMTTYFPDKDIPQYLADSYVKAYEIVAGWEKPAPSDEVPETEIRRPFSGHNFIARHGDEHTLRCSRTKATVRFTLRDGQQADLILPKDA